MAFSSLVEEVSTFGQILLVCFLICLFLSGKALWEHSFSKLPPGPYGLPVIGSCFRLGQNPHLDFTKMAKKYGDVFSLMLGNRLVVVVNGVNAIQETIIKQSTAFAGRPRLHTFQIANPLGSSLSLSDYSPQYRLTRKIGVSAIVNFVKHKDALEEKLLNESQRLVHCFRQHKGKPVDALITLKCATANLILNALFGVERSYDDEGLVHMLKIADNFRKSVHGSNMVDFLPLLKYLPNKALSDLCTTMETILGAVAKMFENNRETYVGGKVRNIADSVINAVERETEKEKEDRSPGEDTLCMAPVLSDEQIVPVLGDLFGAGFETSSITLYWAIAYLIKYPGIQRQLHEELDRVIGRERLPTLQDIESLPLLQASVLELLRTTSVAPLSLPRSTTSETNIGDFTIPKDTVVFINLWSVHRDPDTWKDPDVFDPSRFLDGQGQLIDPKFFVAFLPFSGGRRKCPGEPLVMKSVCVFLAVLLHSFHFTQDGLPTEYQGINLEGQYGLTLMPETFYAKIEERF